MDLRGWTSIDGFRRVTESNTEDVFGVLVVIVLILIVNESVVVESKTLINGYLICPEKDASRSMIE